jgi:hypothetical protein
MLPISTRGIRGAGVLALVLLAGGAQAGAGEWRDLFDGKTLQGWRSLASATPPSSWKVVDGELVCEGGGGDLVSVEAFADFELELEWRVSEGGNSGIFFRAALDGPNVWSTAPEMQVLDNARHADGTSPLTSAGSNYALHAPVRDVTKPVGEWNQARIVAVGPHVEHWLNGVKLLEYELGSPDWEARVKASKFAKLAGYGRAISGHLALQDHGDRVWYRRISIRDR